MVKLSILHPILVFILFSTAITILLKDSIVKVLISKNSSVDTKKTFVFESAGWVDDVFTSTNTLCRISLAVGLQFPDRFELNPANYSLSQISLDSSVRQGLPTCGKGDVADLSGFWVLPCNNSCSTILRCEIEQARWLSEKCRHLDYIGLSHPLQRTTELRNCLSSQTIIATGDSVLRGPLLRMISPLVTQEEVALHQGHSFSTIMGDHGVRIYWDYIAKNALLPHETRDEPTADRVLSHMVDQHIPRTVWKDRPATWVIGGTRSYLTDFENWLESCETENKFGCPWRKSNGGLGSTLVVKGSTISARWAKSCGSSNVTECFHQIYTAEDAIRTKARKSGYGWFDVLDMTLTLWPQLRPGDAGEYACHFCLPDPPVGRPIPQWDEWKGGNVCANVANILATEICGDRSRLSEI